MSQTPHSPLVQFAKAAMIAEGIMLHPLEFNKQPPFTATYFHVLPGCETSLDYHQEQECWIVLQGNGILRYEGVDYSLGVRNMFYFDAHRTHQVKNISENILIICSLYW